MRQQGTFAPYLAIAVAVAVSLTVVEGAEGLRKLNPIGVPGIPAVLQTDSPAPLGPMPRLDPIGRFLPPIDPWVPGGFGWEAEGFDDEGAPLCQTNRRPTPTCDPDGPRAFLHAGFDAAPAPDRVVRASAAGRVVVARPASAFVTGRSQGEGAGIVVLEHDRDGDPATGDDHLLTVYGHVDPEVAVGQIVAEGERIALTSTRHGDHLHFGVRQGPFDPVDLDVFRAFLPPPGTFGCADCYSRPLPTPAFPDLWQDPQELFAAPPSFWLAIYGEPFDGASDVLEADDGYMAFGYTESWLFASTHSMAVRRLDREGNLVSQRAYHASVSDVIKHVERTQDGGIIALAVTITGTGGQSPMLVKFDAAGEPQWARRYGVEAAPGFPPVSLWWEDIAVTGDGGIIVTGTARLSATTVSSVAVTRLDAAGNVLWVKTYDPLFTPRAADGKGVVPTPDGGFVIVAEYQTGASQSQITKDLLVFRIDAAGEVVWGTNLGNGFNDARAGQIEVTPDGDYIVVGYRTLASFFLPSEMWVVKLNGDGTIAWDSLYGSASGNGALEESGTALVVTTDGGYVVAGHRSSFRVENPFGLDTDLVLMRLDGAGEIVGQRRLDSLGDRTTPLGLRAASDGGFLVAAGAETDCRTCPFLTKEAARFVVAHLDGELDCPGQCTVPYDLMRHPRPPTGGAVTFAVGTMTGTLVDVQLARVDTTGRRYPCDHGFFGSPPAFEPASIIAGQQTASCDRTEYVEGFICSVGIPGTQATPPVILDVTYDWLSLTAQVVDGDSTPDRSDVVSVAAILSHDFQQPDPRSAIPMLDDGSLTSLPGPYNNDVADCREDPVAGVCGCGRLEAPAFSGDLVMGDGIYTLETSLTLPYPPSLSDLGKGCVLQDRPRSTLQNFSTETPLSVILQATDRIGNVNSTVATVTPTAATMSCTGDACGCCLLLTSDPIGECAGLPGMSSPDFPDGLCRSF